MDAAFEKASMDDFANPFEVLTDFHRRIEYFLDVLLQTAVSANALTPRQWTAVKRALAYLESAAYQHAANEGKSLFPQIRESITTWATWQLDLLSDLQDEQLIIDGHHSMINRLCRRWLDHGRLSDTDTRDLIDRLEDLQLIYRKHVATEERIVFPCAASLLSQRQLRAIARDIESRSPSPQIEYE